MESKVKATVSKPTISKRSASNVISHSSDSLDGRRIDPASSVDEREDLAALAVDALGVIRYCNRATAALFKYRFDQLLGQHVSMLLPQLADLQLLQDGQPNARIRFLCRVGHHFEGVAQDGERFTSELFLSVLHGLESDRLSLIVRPAEAHSL